ncbi:MAG: hypothetical protein HFG32_03405 [Eubacterium sp.]|nr:hypothetical protein [Eubacterium sp.]
MKVWNRGKGNYAARILALLLTIAVAVQNVSGTGLSTTAEAAQTECEEQEDILKKRNRSRGKNVQLFCNEADLDTNIYTGNDFICSGTKVTVGGDVNARGAVYPWCGRFQASKVTPGYQKAYLPELRSRIEQQSGHWEEQDHYLNINEKEIYNGYKKSASGIQISGTDFRGDCYLMAEESIQYSVNSLNKEGGRIVLYSEKGDICISGSNIVINGILAAPNGNVRINADRVTINGRIYADGVEMSGTCFTMKTSDRDLELLGEGKEEKEIIKIYQNSEDFAEGTGQGTTIRDDKLSLAGKTTTGQTIVRTYNEDVKDGVCAQITLDTDRLGTEKETVTYQISLNGRSSRENQLQEGTDAAFAAYKGNLYAFINKSLLWTEAKEFCEKNGGHLITILDQQENDMAAQLVRKYGCNYTAIGFTDEGNWRWVTGEPSGYMNWNPGEPNNSFGRGQDFGYMYSSGKWDDGYSDKRTPFLCEWEKKDKLVPEEGRQIRLVVEIEGSVEAGQGWNCTEHEDGTTTAVNEAAAISEIRACPLTLEIRPRTGEETTQADGSTSTNTYDQYGRLETATDYNGTTAAYEYDGQDRVTKETKTGRAGGPSAVTTYTYDRYGRVEEASSGNSTIRYTYNRHGELAEKRYENGQGISYGYDRYGRKETVTVKDGENGERTGILEEGRTGRTETEYGYDAAGRLTEEKTTTTEEDGGKTETTYAYAYDAAGNRIRKMEETDGTDTETGYTYNSRNQLVTEETDGEETSYAYDANGNLLEKAGPAATEEYTYDTYNAYGELTRRTGGTENHYLYTGEYCRVDCTGKKEIASFEGFSERTPRVFTSKDRYSLTIILS